MLEIPGFRYDATIKNYVPILNDTPENRALNLVTASTIIKYERINNLKNQIKSAKTNIIRHRERLYPFIFDSIMNIYNFNKYQQTGMYNIKNNKLFNIKRMDLCQSANIEIDEEEELNLYHNVYKSFPPDFDSQLILSSYSSSPNVVHHSLHKVRYTKSNSDVKMHSELVKRCDNVGGIKLSVDKKKLVVLNKKEFSIIDKENLYESTSKFNRYLPQGMRLAFDTSDKLLIGVNSKKGMTHLAAYDLCNDARYSTYKCDWERQWIFSDLMFDNNGANLFLLLRGRMNNSRECILQHDMRCPIPSKKNIRRLSLNFHQNSWVSLTRIPNYSDLIVTHCFDGRCALWDMRWKDRPAVTYRDISPGKSDIPIDIDPTSQFVTMTDSDNVVRIYNLKTGHILFSEKQNLNENPSNHIFSFYNQTGLFDRPTLVSNVSPNVVQIRHLNFMVLERKLQPEYYSKNYHLIESKELKNFKKTKSGMKVSVEVHQNISLANGETTSDMRLTNIRYKHVKTEFSTVR